MGMQKLIFHKSNFFGSGHFLIHEIWKNRPKNDRSQKIYFYEKSVFACRSTLWRNFWILFMLWLYLHDWFLKLYEVISKLCDLGGCSYLDFKCSPSLCLPTIWCTKLEMKYGFPLLKMSQNLIKHIGTKYLNFGTKSHQSRYWFVLISFSLCLCD